MMDVTSRLGRSLIAVLLVAGATRMCRAGEKQQVELLEKAAARFEQLNHAASKYADILEEVIDPQSADSVADEIEPAAKGLIAEIEATAPLIETASKQSVKDEIR